MAMSRIAPAVLGRPSSSIVVLSVGRLMRGGVEVPTLTIDDRLPVAECPRIVDIDVSVSEEIVESGRMYSTLSEKPTRALDGGRGGEESRSSRTDGWPTASLTELLKANCLPSREVIGALPLRTGGWDSAGRMMADRSCEEMAPDRRWACPRRPPGGPARKLGGASVPSSLAGLELNNEMPPVRLSPPINSLPPRLCPIGREGVVGVVMGE